MYGDGTERYALRVQRLNEVRNPNPHVGTCFIEYLSGKQISLFCGVYDMCGGDIRRFTSGQGQYAAVSAIHHALPRQSCNRRA